MKRSPMWFVEKDKLSNIVQNSFTLGEVLHVLGFKNHGANPKTLKNRLKYDQIDYSHFQQRAHSRYKEYHKQDINLILTENSTYHRAALKRRLIKSNMLENKCKECGLFETWNNKPIVLVIDHINGVSDDNRLENLRLLCPNCHSQTPTFAGRNIKKIKQPKKKNNCNICGAETTSRKRCRSCFCKENRKTDWPSKEELERLVWDTPATKIAEKYNVSDSAIVKWCKSYGISKPPRGYWTKQKHSKIV